MVEQRKSQVIAGGGIGRQNGQWRFSTVRPVDSPDFGCPTTRSGFFGYRGSSAPGENNSQYQKKGVSFHQQDITPGSGKPSKYFEGFFQKRVILLRKTD